MSGEDAAPEQPRRTRRTKDGSLYVFDADTHTWRLEVPPGSPPRAVDASGEQLALAWAQFPADFSGGFLIRDVPLVLGPGRSLRSQQEQQHGDTARSVWDGAVAMAKAFEQNPWLVEGRDVLELGAGRGVAGLAAGLLGARSVVLTDLPYAIEDLGESVNLNFPSSAVDGTPGRRAEAAELDWGDAGRFLEGRAGQSFDVAIAADVIWLMELVEPLVGALRLLADRAGGEDGLQVLVMHQLRAQSVEDAFLEAMAREGFVREWALLGGSAAADAVPVAGGAVAWHRDYAPDGRIRLWCFRAAQSSSSCEA